MKNKKLLSRTMSIALTLLMAVSLVLVYAPEANAASSGKLIKTVVRYDREPGSKWKKIIKTEYTYNSQKDPTKIVESYKSGKKRNIDSVDTYRREYTYKNGKKVECKEYLEDYTYSKTITKYDSKERPKTIKKWEEELGYTHVFRYTYGKNGYITKRIEKDDENKKYYLTFKYKWNGKKPKTLKVTEGGNYVEAESKFNKKGLYAGILYIPSRYGRTETVTYECKNGLVNTINVKVKDGKNVYYQKYKITYTKTKIPADRYLRMINSIASYDDDKLTGSTWY